MRNAAFMAMSIALTPAVATAAFLGVEIREDFLLNNAASAAIGQDARVLRLFARFDGAGLIGEDPATTPDPNELVGVTNTAVGATTISLAAGAFYQDTFGTNLPPNPPSVLSLAPSAAFDSYVGIGRLVDEPTDIADTASSLSPDFDWSSPTAIIGSWFNSAPGVNDNGAAVLDSFGRFTVFFAQFTVIGVGRTPSTENDLLRMFGSVQFGVRVPGSTPIGPGVPVLVTVTPTAPSLALFSVAGLAAARRRRRPA